MTTKREKELIKIARDANEELWSIREARQDSENSSLVGKLFKTKNSYSDKESWWLYTKVVGTKDGSLEVFQFQESTRKSFEVRYDDHISAGYLPGHKEISVSEWEKAWKRFIKRVTDLESEVSYGKD